MESIREKSKRLMDEWDRELELKQAARAKENGFSSWEEYNQHEMEEWRLRHEEYERQMDEKCALLGKTREQMYREDPQRNTPDDDGFRLCDCEGEYPTIFQVPFCLTKS